MESGEFVENKTGIALSADVLGAAISSCATVAGVNGSPTSGKILVRWVGLENSCGGHLYIEAANACRRFVTMFMLAAKSPNFAFIVDAKQIKKSVNTAKKGAVVMMSQDEKGLRITHQNGASIVFVSCGDPADWPQEVVPHEVRDDKEGHLRIGSDSVERIEWVLRAASDDPTREHIRAVEFEQVEGRGCIVRATDGKRLHEAVLEDTIDIEISRHPQAVGLRLALGAFRRFQKCKIAEDSDLHVAFLKNKETIFRWHARGSDPRHPWLGDVDWFMWEKIQYNFNFPITDSLWPSDSPHSYMISTTDFADSLNVIDKMGGDVAVFNSATDTAPVLRSERSDKGEIVTSFKVRAVQPPEPEATCKVAFYVSQMRDAVSIENADDVRFSFGKDIEPILVAFKNDTRRALVMPFMIS